jgi:hypothetical protein
MANPLQLPGPNPTQVCRQCTFNELYRDNELDPCKGDYSRIMVRFDPEVNPATSHVMLLELAVGRGASPQAYHCCTTRQNQTKIFCVHMPSRYAGSLDGQTTPWDGNCFAFLGEMKQGYIASINFPSTAFWTVGNVLSHSSDYIVTHLDEVGNYGH